MEKMYSKKGGIPDLKELISILNNFTGIISLDNAKLYYINSKLVFSSLNDKKMDLNDIFKNIPEEFQIDALNMSSNRVNKLLERVSSNNLDEKSIPKDIFVDVYGNIENYVGCGLFKVTLFPRKYKEEIGTILFSNKEEIAAIYQKKDKILVGPKALSKLKTIFAVSDVKICPEKISKQDLDETLGENKDAMLKNFVSFEELMEKIKEKSPKIVENDSLYNILPKNPSIVEIVEKNAVIVSNDKTPIMAFLENYDGDKAYRMIKNFCILNNTVFKIYELTEDEFKNIKEFKNAKIKDVN
jgi:predicted transcriptional regulator with HTH domain